jgi:hypothetical protein
MREARLGLVEGGRHGKDCLPVLNGLHPPRGEARSIANALHIVDDRHFRVAREQKIGVQRMGEPAVHSAARGNQCLPDDLPAEHALPAVLRAAAAKQIYLQLFEVEN